MALHSLVNQSLEHFLEVDDFAISVSALVILIIVGLLDQEELALFLEVFPVGFFLGSRVGCFVLELCLSFLVLLCVFSNCNLGTWMDHIRKDRWLSRCLLLDVDMCVSYCYININCFDL